MTTLIDWFSGPTAESLCLTLLHSLWQGAAWCALLFVVLRRISGNRSEIRYVLALTCLYGLLGGACVTWSVLRQPGRDVVQTPVQVPVDVDTTLTEIPFPATGTSAVPQTGSATAGPSLDVAAFAPWIVSAWLIGACVCLFLASRHVAALRRFQAGTPVDDPHLLRLLAELCGSLGLSRPVQLVSVEGLAVPGVVGVLKPAVLIPTSLLTGLTPGQWEAVLAHELAHIGRWDYLVNLSQLVIESLLFFNPAVWWLSRQVRLEREACCDAIAVRLTARPFQYAELLVSLAERLHVGAAPAVAFARESSSSLLERVRRIVTPGVRSELTMRRSVAASFLVLGLAAVVLLQAGADVAVGVVAKMLNDEQRVAKLVETAEQVSGEPAEELTIRGTIEMEGEKPLVQVVTVLDITRRGNVTAMRRAFCTIDLAETSGFELTVGPGVVFLLFGHPDFAETLIGPYGADAGPVVDDVHVVLRPGIDVPVSIVDELGKPVPDALVTAIPRWPTGGGVSGVRTAPTTDSHGQALLRHINPELSYALLISAPGFQGLSPATCKLTAASPLRLEMHHAQPACGIVVDRSGDAVSGATVMAYRSRRFGETSTGGVWSVRPAVSDAEGKFSLGELEDTWTYDLLVKADGYGPAIIPDVHPGDRDLRVVMVPALTVKGTVHGSRERLQELGGQSSVRWSLQFPDRSHDAAADGVTIDGQQECELVAGVGHFTLPSLAPGLLIIEVGGVRRGRQLTSSIDDFRIDLSEEGPGLSATRPVRISFARDGKRVSPEGELQVSGRSPADKAYRRQSVPIAAGVVELEVPVPDQLHFDCPEMIGFWFRRDGAAWDVPSGEGPFEIEIPVGPAGAVKGNVVNTDGTPAARADLVVRFRLEELTAEHAVTHTDGLQTETNEKGEFFLSPIPFGAECSIEASRRQYVVVGGEFTMSAEDALPSYTIELGPGADAKLRLLDPSGSPLVGQPAELNCRHPLASHGWGPAEFTDRKGECLFRQLNPDLAGYYVARVDFTRDYVPVDVPLNMNGKETVFRVRRGKVIEGTVVDSQDRPLEGVPLVARPVNWQPGGELRFRYLPEAKTDSQGRFRFSNLPAAEMNVRQETWPGRGTTALPVDADEAKPVTVRKPD